MASSSSPAMHSGSDSTEHILEKTKIVEESNSRDEEETYFSKLVDLTLATVINLKEVSKDDLIEAKDEISDAFIKFKFHEVNLSQWKYSCAFVYRHGMHGAGLTRCKVIKALQNCQDLASKFEESSTLNILSFGGGPGNDIVGFCSALCELNVCEKNLKLTVADLFREWSLYVDLLKVFIKEGNFGKVSDLFRNNKTNMSFLEAPQDGCPGSQEYLNALKNADIILMVKVLSSIENGKRQEIVERIYEGMKNGAFLIFIGSFYEETWWRRFECLYVDPHLGDEENRYISSTTSTIINFDDEIMVRSRAGVIVLRK